MRSRKDMDNITLEDAKWWQTGIIYQIYPRSFMDSNEDGIGDLKGIVSKLDYLNDGTPESLGIDAIWLSPINPSPDKDFGYDISDYKDISQIYGKMDDFKLLLEEAHKRNIKIVMDLVINHTSDLHPWFIESRKSRDNPYHDWYIWHEGINGKPPNNWFAAFDKKAWWWVEEVEKFYYSSWTRYQPEVNWRNPKLKEAMYDVIKFWLDMGVDGYRMDVVNWYIKDDQYRSNPYRISFNPPDYQIHKYDRNRPETHGICKEIRQIVDNYSDRMTVGEIFTDESEVAAEYYGKGDELHLAFNFAFLFQRWKASHFHRIIERWEELTSGVGWPNYTLSNHDRPRHFSRYGKPGESESRAKIAAAMMFTLRGTPFIYYGEEIGMSDRKIKRSQIKDPLGIKFWPFMKGRDPARTPMQWDDSPNAGFSNSIPWLPVHPNYNQVNVKKEKEDPLSILSFYRNLIWKRKQYPALLVGDYESIIKQPKDYLAYLRSYQNQSILVLLNFTNRAFKANLMADQNPKLKGEWKFLFGTHRKEGDKVDLLNLSLREYEVLLAIKG